MIKKCNYSSFFNEFNISINLKYNLIPFFNGYYFAEEYEKYLYSKIDNYKNDLLFELPLSNDGEPIIFLNNLHEELCKKESKLKRYKKYSRKKTFSPSFNNKYNFITKIENRYHRRNFKMQVKQLFVLRNAILITEQALDSFKSGFVKENLKANEDLYIKDTKNAKVELKLSTEIVWSNSYKLGLIQLIKSLIKIKVILIGTLEEKEAISIIANYLNVSINNDNYSSFSRAVHNYNFDYQPKIFKELLKGYEILSNEIREKRERDK